MKRFALVFVLSVLTVTASFAGDISLGQAPMPVLDTKDGWAGNAQGKEVVPADTFGNVTANQSIPATLAQTCTNFPIMVTGATSLFFNSLQSGFDAATNGETIKIQAVTLTENPYIDRNIAVILRGGYDCDYVADSSYSKLTGTLTVSNGTVLVSNLVIGAPTLSSIAVTSTTATVDVGSTQQFTATGTYSDRTTSDITTQVTWSSSNRSVATVNSSGLATAVGVGTTTITATLGSISGSTTLTVTTPPTPTNEYRGLYLNTINPSDTGSWSLAFIQNGGSFSGMTTLSGSTDRIIAGVIKDNTGTVTGSNTYTAFTFTGNSITGTVLSSGNKYNFTAALHSGAPLRPVAAGNVLIGGTFVSGNAPNPTSAGHTPKISNFQINPSSGPVNTVVTFKLRFDDTAGDVTTLGVVINGRTGYYTYNTENATTGQVSFNLSLSDTIGNIIPGSVSIQVFVKDAAGNISNYLNGTYIVSGPVSLDKIATKDYWVLGNNNSYTYTNSGSQTMYLGTFPQYNITDTVFKVSKFIGGALLSSGFEIYDTAGFLLWYGGIWPSGNFYIVSPSAAYYPAEIEIGKTYPFNINRSEYDEKGQFHGIGNDVLTFTISGPEIITVPAGTFTTYKLHEVDAWTNSYGESGTDINDYWLSKNIGIVKVEMGGLTFELTSATVGGNHYP